VTAAIRADDVRELEIWLVGDRMFMILEQGEAYDAGRQGGPRRRRSGRPGLGRADAHLPKAAAVRPGQTWVEMERIYALSEQPAPNSPD
jgi:L-rhamnose mutarotase